jgi:hypothetical protein
MEQWIEEFLYRGRPPSGPGSEQLPVFHVMVGQQAPDPIYPEGPPVRRIIGPLTPEQAAAMGLTLPDLVAGINDDAIEEVLARRARQGPLERELAEREERRTAELARLKDLEMENGRMRVSLEAKQRRISDRR